ncbi:hypothetical protein STRCI_008398 [Streptomyces cinnabarinus]|uniref:Uncharacterized protein n=1 Tax=Streptomyces cinnabarinus TaxID=67287 RepID=A0ABY7KT31_9ACTN|nr:hypothetical protein [Streptomyces cinnabarinus]WAZ26765.1 hypothetical protein STRCI_008398 [Streptomyces cinnabarinus]
MRSKADEIMSFRLADAFVQPGALRATISLADRVPRGECPPPLPR